MSLLYDLYLVYTIAKNYSEYKQYLKEMKDDGLKLLFFINREYKKHLDSRKDKVVEYDNVKVHMLKGNVEYADSLTKSAILRNSSLEDVEIIHGYTDELNNDQHDDTFDDWTMKYNNNDMMNSFDSLHMYCD